MCATELVPIEDKSKCYMLIVSAIAKMMEAKPRRLSNPFEGILSRQLVVLQENSYVWEPIGKKFKEPKWTEMPMTSAKKFFVLKSFASSKRSRVLLGGTSSGAVCVIKFLRDNGLKFYVCFFFFFFLELILTSHAIDVNGEKAEDRLNAEMNFWKEIYPQYAKGIRIVTLNNKPALLLPHFDHPSNRDDNDVLKAIETTLKNDYAAKGLYHDDVRWRNIGIRRSREGLHAVVFDMESVERVNAMSSDQMPGTEWVAEKISDLRKRI